MHGVLHSYTVSYPTFLGAQYDASATNLTYHIPPPSSYPRSTPPLEIVLSFLSPITPTSTLRQAIPASYLTVHVSGGFDVNVYVDVNGLWVTGDRGNDIVWELGQTELGEGEKGLKTWKVKRKTEQLLTEHEDRAEWGTLHFTAPSVSAGHFTGNTDERANFLHRTCAMNLALRPYSDSALQRQGRCKIP